MSKVKIAFISSWFPSRVHATDGNFVEKHARLLAADYDLIVLHIQEDPALEDQQWEFVIEPNVGFSTYQLYYGWNGRGGEWRKRWLRWKVYRKLWAEMQQHWGQPAIMHANILFDAGIVAAIWSWRYQIPFILAEHSSIYQHPQRLRWYHRQVAAWVARKASYLLPVSHNLRLAMERLGIHGLWKVFPNSVNADLFQSSALPPATRPFRYLHISNFAPAAKNTTGILRAFSQLTKATPDCQLTIAGDGDLAPLQELAQTLQLEEPSLRLLGSQSEREVASLMQAHHVFVLFSNYENLPVVLLEAQCCGMPIIATKVGGISEIVDSSQKGILVDPGDEKSLVAAFMQIREDYKQYDREEIAEVARQRYGENLLRKRFIELYKQIVDH